MNFAPIVVFAFNRLDSLKKCIDSLLKNEESKFSDLYIFVDGAREDKSGEYDHVKCVQEYVQEITGFKSLTYEFSETNKGLGNSVISGVSKVIDDYGSAIVLEDDLIVSHNFLSYLNQGLVYYRDKGEVFSICAWSPFIHIPESYKYDAYTCVRSSSWGWATWKDRWNSVDWNLKDWKQCESNKRQFNDWGGSDSYGMLKGWKLGKNNSWAIRFVYSQFVQNKISVFSNKCLVDNYGFDGKGIDCPKYCRTKWNFEDNNDKLFIFPERLSLNKSILKQVMSYRTLQIRIKAKLINMMLNVFPFLDFVTKK